MLMEKFMTNISNFLSIIGLLSIIISFLKLFYNNKKYDNSIIIYCSDNIENTISKYRYIEIMDLHGNNHVVIEPNCCIISSIKVYNTKINGKGCLKRTSLIDIRKNIKPNTACILNVDYTCGIPNKIIEIKNCYGGKCNIELIENGFNGNNDYANGLEFKYPLYIRIFNSIFR